MKKTNNNKALKGPRTLKSELLYEKATDSVSSLINETIKKWNAAKHPKVTDKEVDLFNSIMVEECRNCGSKDFKKFGFLRNGIRRYRCNDCKRTFTSLTGTVFDSIRIPLSQWLEFLLGIYDYESVLSSSIGNMNAYSTGKYWLSKTFSVLKDTQTNVLLSGNVYIDETYFPVMPRDVVLDKNGKKLRGLSRNNHCVFTATDGRDVVLIANGKGKPSSRKTFEALATHISAGSQIIDDGERSHGTLVKGLSLRREIHKTKETKKLKDNANPMDPINNIHGYLKLFMRAHGSYNRDNLQDWLNLFRLVWLADDKRSFLLSFINAALKHRKIMRYRDVFKKKS